MRKASYENAGSAKNYRGEAERLKDQELMRHTQSIVERVTERRETFSAIARELLPHETEFEIVAGQMAVSLLAQQCLDPATYLEVVKRNRTEGAKNARKSARPDGYEEDPQHDFNHGKKPRWVAEELLALFDLLEDPTFQYQNGPHEGEPCFPAIAAELNREFADLREPRRPNAYASKIRRILEEESPTVA